MSKLSYLYDNGNSILLYFQDGSIAKAEPTVNSNTLWLIGEASDIPSGDTDFVWPFDPDHATSEFGWRTDPFGSGKQVFHSGIDGSTSAGVGDGADVIAAGDGVVIAAGWAVRGGWGNSIIIDHGIVAGVTIWSGYAHMQTGSPFFDVGDTVNKNDVLGIVGSTGSSVSPHLHFSIWENGSLINPRNFMDNYV